jgi:uncharacterized membrane protein
VFRLISALIFSTYYLSAFVFQIDTCCLAIKVNSHIARSCNINSQYRNRIIMSESLDNSSKEESKTPTGNEIVVSAQIDLPFSAEIAFDAYSDLPRQPSWSTWLSSVEYFPDSTTESKWTMSYLGLSFSWKSICMDLVRPQTIGWESTQGLRNAGRVDFTKLSDNETRMKLQMTFYLPWIVARMLRSSGSISKRVETMMLEPTLRNFQTIVMEKDVKKSTQQEPSAWH